MIESIEREGTKVVIKINMGLEVSGTILPLSWECQHEYVAELLKDQLWKQFKEFKMQIANQTVKYPLLYLTRKEVSELKSMLVKEWNGVRHCRK